MPTLDSTARAAAAASVVAPVFYIFLDVVGDPVRVTTGPGKVFAATGDAELDGTYSAIDPRVVTVGDVTQQENGSDTLTVALSGIVSIDTALMNEIGDVTKWKGRVARLWMEVRDGAGAVQGAIVPFYTGYMAAASILPSPKTQTIQLSIENYLAAFNAASNRSYQGQKDYDAADTSGAATLAASNGARGPAGETVAAAVSQAGTAGGDQRNVRLD